MTIWLRAWGEPAAAPPPEAGGGPWDAILCNCWCRGVGGGENYRIGEGAQRAGDAPCCAEKGYPVGNRVCMPMSRAKDSGIQGHATGRESGDFELRGNADQAGL